MAAKSDVRQPGYVGLNDHDIAAHLRHHAQCIADGDHPRPVRAVLVEFDGNGQAFLYRFGGRGMPAREAMHLYVEASQVLLQETQVTNADASN